jgi:hypothetical protein
VQCCGYLQNLDNLGASIEKNKLSWYLSQCTFKILTMTWLAFLTQLKETFSNTSFSPMAALLLLTLNTTGKIRVTHGTHIILWNPYSSRSRTMLITQREGGFTISEAQQLETAYAKIFASGIFHSVCRHWNEIIPAEQTWNAFKAHFETTNLATATAVDCGIVET